MILSFVLLAASAVAQSPRKMPRRKLVAQSPQCAQGAICFSGEAREGQEYRRTLNSDLDFVMRLPGGFDIVPNRGGQQDCKLSAWVANPPLMAHHDTEIDAAHDWTAEQEVQTSPREFRFPTNCAEYDRLFQLSQADPQRYAANLTVLAKGEGRLWITDSKVTHSHGTVSRENGAVEWIRFTVEIKLPAAK